MKKYLISGMSLVLVMILSAGALQLIKGPVDENVKTGEHLELPESIAYTTVHKLKGPVAKNRYPFRKNKRRAYLMKGQ